jgi:biotin carboxylase
MSRLIMIETNMSGSGFEALRLARLLGIDVTFVTRDLDLYRAVPGVARIFSEYVDEILVGDTNDVDAVVELTQSRMRRGRVDGLVALGEYHVAVAAGAARRLGFAGPDPDAVRTARNKDRMRAVCLRTGLPSPRFAVVHDEDAARRAAGPVGLPCVVKPADESGSIDVLLCREPHEVVTQFRAIRDRSVNYRGQRRNPAVLVEEYVVGCEVSVETLGCGDGARVLGVTDKQLAAAPRFVEMGHAFPSGLPADSVSGCARLAVNALEAIGYRTGPAHVEIRIGPQGPRLIEVNPRCGGDRIPDLVELATGVSMLAETLRLGLGERPHLSPVATGGAAVRFLAAEPGRVRRVAGLETARTVPGVVDVRPEVGEGDIVRPLRDAHDRAAYVVARGETTYEACRTAETALAQLHVDTVPA